MRYYVDGVETSAAGYKNAPAGKSKAVVGIDDNATIAASYRERIKAIDEKKPDPCTKAELQAEITRLGG